MKKLMKNLAFQAVSLAILLVGMGVTYAAWNTINTSEGAAGQPVTQTLVQKIINNLNDLNTRLTAVESKTTGGTVTGPLRWSAEYTNQAYPQAWATCLALAPAGSWRMPTADDIEYGKIVNGGLFTGSKNYWSSSPSGSSHELHFLAWYPTGSIWEFCKTTNTSSCSNNDGATNGNLMAFRCVSNAY